MSYVYIPIASPALALELSETLFKLSRLNKKEWEISNRFCGWVSHPFLDSHYMELVDEPFYIHPQADKNQLDSILNRFVLQGLIFPQDIEKVRNAIVASRGKKVDVTVFIPKFWLDRKKTRAQLELLGFFPETKMLG